MIENTKYSYLNLSSHTPPQIFFLSFKHVYVFEVSLICYQKYRLNHLEGFIFPNLNFWFLSLRKGLHVSWECCVGIYLITSLNTVSCDCLSHQCQGLYIGFCYAIRALIFECFLDCSLEDRCQGWWQRSARRGVCVWVGGEGMKSVRY